MAYIHPYSALVPCASAQTAVQTEFSASRIRAFWCAGVPHSLHQALTFSPPAEQTACRSFAVLLPA